jgi:hypothetical protein
MQNGKLSSVVDLFANGNLKVFVGFKKNLSFFFNNLTCFENLNIPGVIAFHDLNHA